MTDALATIQPTTLSELQTFAKTCAESGFFGSLNPQQALVIAMAGRDLGFSYTQALRAFSVIKGKPTLTADGMVAAVLARGICEYFRPIEQTDQCATWEAKRTGCEPVRYSFSMDDAARAGLINDMYRRHPRRMLSARAKAYLARDLFPEVLLGLVTEDEAEEISRRPVAAVAAPAPRPAPVVVAQVVEAVPAVVEAAPAVAEAPEPSGPSLYERIQAAATVEDLASLWRASAQERQALPIDEQAQVKAVFAERKAGLGSVS